MESFLPSEIKHYLGCKPSLKCFHLNTQSAKNKIADLEDFFVQFDNFFDVVMLSETWYSDDINVFNLPMYSTHLLNRTRSRGGGVSMLIKDCIDCEPIPEYCCTTKDYEVLSLRANRNVFSVFYRPPDGSFSEFFSFLEEFLMFTNTNRYNLICGGDFNINMLFDHSHQRELKNTIELNGCMNVITSPTRITLNSETLLDLFITNFASINVKAGVVRCDLSDHFPIFISVDTNSLDRPKVKQTAKLQYITLDSLESFRRTLSNTDWSAVYEKETVDEAYNIFINIFKKLYQQKFPYKKLKISRNIRKPWITPDILGKIHIKNVLYDKFIKTRDLVNLKIFKSYRNQLTKEIRNAKSRYHSDSFKATFGRTDRVWNILNSVLARSKTHCQIDHIFHNGARLAQCSLANAFNDHFVDLVNMSSTEDACKYLKSRNSSSIFFHPVNEAEVVSIISQLKNSTSCDPDDVQIKPVKYVSDIIAPCLTYIFNLSLTSGIFPQNMQIAKVTVLFKKGDKNKISNYRPISILPVFSKCIEKVLHYRLVSFSDKYDLLSSSQFGFRKNKSTEKALLEQKECILREFERGNLMLGVFIDFTKAFDYLDHNILLKKLEYNGIRGTPLKLVESYLKHRKQYVNIAGYSSEIKHITAGVPQGSILGPFLFNIYINDIININSGTKFIIYADDTSVFFSGTNGNELIDRANMALTQFGAWAQCNCLKINTNKTKAVLFRPKNKIIELNKHIFLNSCPIEMLSSFKTLGVLFSENMLWDTHVQSVISRLSRVIGLTHRHQFVLPTSVKLLIYNSLFYSSLSYCHLVWGTTTFTNLEKLYLLQKKMLRIISNVSYHSHTQQLFERFQVLDIKQLYNYRLTSSFKLERSRQSSFFSELASLQCRIPTHTTRHVECWKVTKCNNNYGYQMLKYTLPKILNWLDRKKINIAEMSFSELRGVFLDLKP